MAAQGPFTPPDPSGWLSPARLPVEGTPYGAPVSSAPPMYELRPLTTSEVLDRTFSLYRSKFWLFAGIACFTSVLQSLVGALQMFFQSRTLTQMRQIQAGAPPQIIPSGMGASMILIMIASVVLFIGASVTMAACVFAVGETYLGRPTSIKESFRATIGRWYAYIGIAFWQLGSFLWLPFVLLLPGGILLAIGVAKSGALAAVGGVLLFLGFTGGLVGGIMLGLRNAFGVLVAVLERMPVRQAMRRSKFLTDGTKWRIILIGLVAWALLFVVGILQAPLAFVTAMLLMKGSHAYITQALTLVINFVGYTVVTPVAMIGNSLLYFDQRVRKEAFDIAFLMGEEQALERHAPLQPAYGESQNTPQAVDVSTL